MDLTTILSNQSLIALLAVLLYASAGAVDGLRKGEKFNPALFGKTIALGLVADGVITQATSDALLTLLSTPFFTVLADNVINGLFRGQTQGAAGPPSTP